MLEKIQVKNYKKRTSSIHSFRTERLLVHGASLNTKHCEDWVDLDDDIK